MERYNGRWRVERRTWKMKDGKGNGERMRKY